MEKVNIWDIEETEFPAGRRTRVILGQNGAMGDSKLCQDYVVVYRDDEIPEHDHETVEPYTILKGHGEMEVGGEKQSVKEGDCIFISNNLKHSLYNTEEEELHMTFVYIPGTMVDHCVKEQSGEIKQYRQE